MTQRVVVTGLGPLTPLGSGVEAFWDGLHAGRIATRRISRFDASALPSQVAAEILDFDPSAYVDARTVRRTDRFAQFGLAASALALADAKFSPNEGREVGVFLGSALGGLAYAEEEHDRFLARGIRAVHPLLATSVFGGASSCNVSQHFGFHGPVISNANSCASGAVAIGEAFRAIARGDVRAALAGGVEAPLAPLTFGAFAVIRAMSRRNDEPARASRPFDRGRDGFVMAEGAGVLVLERREDALARAAPIYGEIVGYGLTADGYHMTKPRPDGSESARAIRLALAEAQLAPDELELIDAHGSGTPLGDAAEVRALEGALGAYAKRVPVVATKGQHGHALGATGAWEAIAVLLAFARGELPGTTNLDDDDPECALAFVRKRRQARVRNALSLSLGFGGLNAALAFRAVVE
ncbi:MAG: beta-ketoacyl-[acyl-carrier-protein] synthase family protein [Vulcanimicrobiaceae bacterium]